MGSPEPDPDGQTGEHRRLAQLLAGRRPPSTGLLQVDLGDDCAVLADGTAITVDTMVQGVHWDHRLDPADLGWKLVAVNASDLGAMGARPAWALLSLSLPRELDPAWLPAFSRGLHEGLGAFGLSLIGGDTTTSPGPIALSLTVGGRVLRPVRRGGGRAGDVLWVSGRLGASARGFFQGGAAWADHARPRPPVALGVALAEAGLARAMMDLSDGLHADLNRLCAACGLGAEIDPAALPLAPGLADEADAMALAVAWGEDYELLFAAAPEDGPAIEALSRSLGVAVQPIGALCPALGARLRGSAWPAPLFSHFGAPR
jgi:thiamine-monophosphate kinase